MSKPLAGKLGKLALRFVNNGFNFTAPPDDNLPADLKAWDMLSVADKKKVSAEMRAIQQESVAIFKRVVNEAKATPKRVVTEGVGIKFKLEAKAVISTMKLAAGGKLPTTMIAAFKTIADIAKLYKDDPVQMEQRLKKLKMSPKDIKEALDNPAEFLEKSKYMYDLVKQ